MGGQRPHLYARGRTPKVFSQCLSVRKKGRALGFCTAPGARLPDPYLSGSDDEMAPHVVGRPAGWLTDPQMPARGPPCLGFEPPTRPSHPGQGVSCPGGGSGSIIIRDWTHRKQATKISPPHHNVPCREGNHFGDEIKYSPFPLKNHVNQK